MSVPFRCSNGWIDRNRITCAGVTAGLDFALTTIATIWGQDQAEMVQLGSEYAPQPPFAAGSPLTAPAALVERFRSVTGPMHDARKAAIARALR
jgi:cyclohexyl-isocyanide hydratase